jgi:hypothetical protein
MSALGHKRRSVINQSIARSARRRVSRGTVRPNMFAVLRLITREKRVGCSTGIELCNLEQLPPDGFTVARSACRDRTSSAGSSDSQPIANRIRFTTGTGALGSGVSIRRDLFQPIFRCDRQLTHQTGFLAAVLGIGALIVLLTLLGRRLRRGW